MKDSGFYLDLFRVTPGMLDRVLAKALSGGASYADLYFEHTVYREISIRDSEVSSGGVHVDYGTGIRAVEAGRTGYSYCETTAPEEMMRAAAAAAGIGSSAGTVRIPSLHSVASERDFYPAASSWKDEGLDIQTALLKGMDSRLRSKDCRIGKVLARISSSESYVMMYNSAGELTCDFRPMGSVSASIMFSDGKICENRSASRSFRCGPEMLTDGLFDEIAGELCGGIDRCLEAGKPKGGRMPVVMGAGASGILLHEAMGHAFEADFNRKGQSIFSDRMGQRICGKGIDIVDDATREGNRGSCNFDDEGVAGKKTYMVKDGILTSYLHDRISAEHYGVEPTGNGRRESFRYNPIPRMRLTYMENGGCSPSDIISSVKKGIFVDEFSNGEVNIGEGDFTFYVKSGYMIENGRLTAPIKDINVIGNGPAALADIEAVGNDLRIDDGCWTCGKDQSVPVGCGIPTVLIRELTVGGE